MNVVSRRHANTYPSVIVLPAEQSSNKRMKNSSLVDRKPSLVVDRKRTSTYPSVIVIPGVEQSSKSERMNHSSHKLQRKFNFPSMIKFKKNKKTENLRSSESKAIDVFFQRMNCVHNNLSSNEKFRSERLYKSKSFRETVQTSQNHKSCMYRKANSKPNVEHTNMNPADKSRRIQVGRRNSIDSMINPLVTRNKRMDGTHQVSNSKCGIDNMVGTFITVDTEESDGISMMNGSSVSRKIKTNKITKITDSSKLRLKKHANRRGSIDSMISPLTKLALVA